MKVSVSVVLYAPDMELLAQVVSSLSSSCAVAERDIGGEFCLDLVNNKPDDLRISSDLTFILGAITSGILDIRLIQANANVGYGAGNNLSIRRNPDSDFHLVLNPDVLLHEDTILNAIKYMQANPVVGLLTPEVRGLDGELHHLCKRNPTLLDMCIRSLSMSGFEERMRIYEMRDCDYASVIRPVSYPTGCFMFFRGKVLGAIGGFDERYFLHYEDADIGRKVQQVSETSYVPDVKVVHKWTRGTHRSWAMRWITIKSGIRYWWKWGGIY